MNKVGVVRHIEACNRAGRLALVVYLLYGHPSLETSRAAFELLRRYRGIFECSLPIASLHPSSASSAIVGAHDRASRSGLSDEAFLSFYARYRPNLLAHIRDNERRDADELFGQVRGRCDAVMTDYAPFAATLLESSAHAKNVPLLVQSVSALSGTLERDFKVYEGDMLIHLAVAPRSGGELLALKQLQTAVDKITKVAPHAKILCGYGVRGAAEITRIRRLRGVHGVTTGTEPLRRLATDLAAFESWLAATDQELNFEYT